MIFYDIIAVFGCQQKQNRKARNGTQAIPYGNVIVPFDMFSGGCGHPSLQQHFFVCSVKDVVFIADQLEKFL